MEQGGADVKRWLLQSTQAISHDPSHLSATIPLYPENGTEN